jgi:hypothetical protein
MEELATRFVDPLVRVSAEEIALPLQQIGWQSCSSVTVEEGKRSREGRHGNTELHALNDGAPP